MPYDIQALRTKYGISDQNSGYDISSLRQKYGIDAPSTPPEDSGKPFKYDVPQEQKTSAEKIAQYNQEQGGYDAATKKANSVGGIVWNTLKGVGTTLTSSEQGLGKTIATEATDPKQYADNVKHLADSQVTLQKLISEREKRGIDTTSIKRAYNSNADLIKENQDAIDAYSSSVPTTAQAAGQIGGTALDVLTAGTYGKAAEGAKSFQLSKGSVPFIKAAGTAVAPEVGKVAEIASKPSGLFTAKGFGNVAKGAGTGYGYDVTQGLQGGRGENRTGFNSLIPGAGTVLGAGIPAVTEGFQSILNKTNPTTKANIITNNRKTELNKLDRYSNVEKVVQKNKNRGIDVKDIVANTDLLHGAVDKDGHITTKGEGNAIDQVQQFIKPQEDVIVKNLEQEGISLTPAKVRRRLNAKIESSGISGKARTTALNNVDAEIAGYRTNKEGNIPLAELHKAKIDKYAGINFMTDAEKQRYDKSIAGGLKELVQENTKSVDVKRLNDELARNYAVINYLEKLDGKKVEGGKLGKYFARTVGAMVGGHFGPLGAIAGAEVAGKIKGSSMAATFGGKTGKGLSQSQLMRDAIKKGNAPRSPLPALIPGNDYIPAQGENIRLPQKSQSTLDRLERQNPNIKIPQSSNSFGNRNTSQSTTTTPIKKGMPNLIPQPKNKVNKKQ